MSRIISSLAVSFINSNITFILILHPISFLHVVKVMVSTELGCFKYASIVEIQISSISSASFGFLSCVDVIYGINVLFGGGSNFLALVRASCVLCVNTELLHVLV